MFESIKLSDPNETIICQINISETTSAKPAISLKVSKPINDLNDIKIVSSYFKDKITRRSREEGKREDEIKFVDLRIRFIANGKGLTEQQ